MSKVARFRLVYAVTALACAASFVLAHFSEADGLLLGMLAATLTVITFLRQQVFRVQRWFVHGYHAGYHDASPMGDCYDSDCAVLSAGEARIRV